MTGADAVAISKSVRDLQAMEGATRPALLPGITLSFPAAGTMTAPSSTAGYPVAVTSSAIPTGAATAAKQDAIIAAIGSTNTKLDALIAAIGDTNAKLDAIVTALAPLANVKANAGNTGLIATLT